MIARSMHNQLVWRGVCSRAINRINNNSKTMPLTSHLRQSMSRVAFRFRDFVFSVRNLQSQERALLLGRGTVAHLDDLKSNHIGGAI